MSESITFCRRHRRMNDCLHRTKNRRRRPMMNDFRRPMSSYRHCCCYCSLTNDCPMNNCYRCYCYYCSLRNGCYFPNCLCYTKIPTNCRYCANCSKNGLRSNPVP